MSIVIGVVLMAIAEVTISVLLGFISGVACGVMVMAFWIRHKEKKIETGQA